MLFALLLAVGASLAAVHWQVERFQVVYGTSVNLAGRQRMLSQRMTADALRLLLGFADAQAVQRIERDIAEFESILARLQHGSPREALPPEQDTATAQELRVLATRWNAFRHSLESALRTAPHDPAARPLAGELADRGAALLEAAERVVRSVQTRGAARRALERSTRAERFLLAVGVSATAAAWFLTLRMADTLAGAERRFRELAESAAEGILLADSEGSVGYANPAACRMLGRPRQSLEGTHIRELLPRAAVRPGTWEGQVRRPDGEVVLLQGSTSASAGRAGVFSIHLFRDVTPQVRLEQRVTYLASHDLLTGLFNRRRLQQELERWLAEARRFGEAGALAVIDLDAFKDLNNTLGQQAGDEVLAGVAAFFRERLQAPDLVARLGADEFALLLPRTPADKARERIAALIGGLREREFRVAGQPVHVSASGGFALFPEHGGSAEELFRRAELAMQHAKRRGRNRVEPYRAELENGGEPPAFTWEQRLRQALAEDRLVLVAQPILHLPSRRVTRCELLLRLPDEQGQLISPAVFLPAAERAGLVGAIDRWVVRQALRLITEQTTRGHPVCLEVNLSPQALTDVEFLQELRGLVTSSGLAPGSLMLEITETAAVADLHQARVFMHSLRETGCRFALDDFGVGFGSFLYLKHLPVDCVKIDGAFVRNLDQDPVDARIVKAIVDVAHGLETETVAEFVEDEATLRRLVELGVDYAQGYLVGRPRPAAEACQLIGSAARPSSPASSLLAGSSWGPMPLKGA